MLDENNYFNYIYIAYVYKLESACKIKATRLNISKPTKVSNGVKNKRAVC